MAVVYRPNDDITASRADILVNTVNCVGVMGKGVAKAFKTAFPSIMPAYQHACRTGQIRPGHTILFPLPVPGAPRHWAAMATKDHWREGSQLAWITTALTDLARQAEAAGARSIAIPPPAAATAGSTGGPSSRCSSSRSGTSISRSTPARAARRRRNSRQPRSPRRVRRGRPPGRPRPACSTSRPPRRPGAPPPGAWPAHGGEPDRIRRRPPPRGRPRAPASRRCGTGSSPSARSADRSFR